MFHIYCTNRPDDVRPGTLGTAVEGYTLKLLPEDAEGPGAPEVAEGETGVLWVRGRSAAMGYHGDRQKSFATFFGAWCRTGDLFRRDASGAYVFLGRADDLLKVSGIWVAPVEVEACLVTHDAVTDAAVIGSEEDGLTKVKAFVILRDDARTEDPAALAALADALRELVKARLSKHKYPRWVVFCDDLPKNDRGKVDKRLLKEREGRGENPRGH
jgi:acyl-coenzyme A synthetase/AMP-(fatty) acid ligase